MKRRILVVEDDHALASILHARLAMEGFAVALAANGHEALRAVKAFTPDLAVLDVGLPDIDGFALCRAWRKSARLAVIMLTARGERADKLTGLTAGADDYIIKPFDSMELIARIHAVLRRTRPEVERLQLGDVTIDFRQARAWRDTIDLELSRREFDVLHYLAERVDTIVHRDELLRAIWGYAEVPLAQRAVDQAIIRLRRKIEPDPHRPAFIHTAHGDGYFLTVETSPDPPARPVTR
ncbi:MAG: response regulator transcription factor [Vicinamibacterales bacterium]